MCIPLHLIPAFDHWGSLVYFIYPLDKVDRSVIPVGVREVNAALPIPTRRYHKYGFLFAFRIPQAHVIDSQNEIECQNRGIARAADSLANRT